MLKLDASSYLNRITMQNTPKNVKKNLNIAADYFTRNVKNIYSNSTTAKYVEPTIKEIPAKTTKFDSTNLDKDAINILKSYGKHNNAIDLQDSNMPENVRLNLNV